MLRRAFCACLWPLLAAGCAGGQVKEAKDTPFVEPGFEFKGMSFENEGFSGLDLVLKFELVSKDSRKVTVVACPYKLELDGLEPISGTASPSGELSGSARIQVTNRLKVPWPRTTAEVQEFLDRKKIPYKFTQTCNAQGPAGPLSLSVSDAGSVPLPRLPVLTVSGANAERFGRRDIRLNFELSIINENAFKMKIDKIFYRVEVEGKPMAEGEMTVAESVPPSNEVSYDIATQILSGNESKEINELVKKPSIEYHLVGKVVSGDFEIPVDATGNITFPH